MLRKFGKTSTCMLLMFTMATSLLAGCNSTKSTNGQAGSSNSENKKKIVMKLAENQPDNNPVTDGDKKFAELLDKKTNGNIKIDVYANAQLGQETETIEQTKAGVLEIARVNSVVYADTVKEMGVFALPYIFTDNTQKYKVLDGEIGANIAKAAEKQGMKVLAYLDAGTRHFYTTKKEVKTLADLKGLKMRVQPAKISLRMVELLGAKPTPMNYGEVYSALQTGVIDGAENDFVSYKTSSHNEVAKNLILDGHLSPPAVLIMNKKTFDGLSAEDQKNVLDAAKEAAEYERKLMIETNDKYRQEVEKSGTKVTEVNVAEFQKAVEPLYSEFPEFKDTIEKIKTVK